MGATIIKEFSDEKSLLKYLEKMFRSLKREKCKTDAGGDYYVHPKTGLYWNGEINVRFYNGKFILSTWMIK